MPIVDWNHYKEQWPHLRNINFPSSSKRSIVDILIELDCADLLYRRKMWETRRPYSKTNAAWLDMPRKS